MKNYRRKLLKYCNKLVKIIYFIVVIKKKIWENSNLKIYCCILLRFYMFFIKLKIKMILEFWFRFKFIIIIVVEENGNKLKVSFDNFLGV